MAQTVQKMGLDEVKETMEWAEREGWQPGLGDATAFFAADPNGFFRAVEDGRTTATISVVSGSAKVAFVGLYIVPPELRGQGHGRALWDEVLSHFDGFTLGLDAVPEQVATYERDGFVPAYGNSRFSVDSAALPAAEPSGSIFPASIVSEGDLVEFDAAHFFGPRPDFLRHWINGEGRNSLVAVDGGTVIGFAASRPAADSFRIGPVFARDMTIARELILNLAAEMTGPVSIDLPRPNHAATELAESLGMEPGFDTTRMYRGDPPELPLHRVFGITSLELG